MNASHNVEQKKPGTKQYRLCDSIYPKFKHRLS